MMTALSRRFASLFLSFFLFSSDLALAQLEEVLVTARRQSESLQETPVAVTAIGEGLLQDAGISALQDVRELVPGLQIVDGGSKTRSLYIRGIGQRSDRSDLDPGVGQYLNGIFIARTDSTLLDAVDVANIQVLRGPQGTLFGKNNTGGAMLISTRRPDTQQAAQSLSGKLGENGRQDIKLAANWPLPEGRGGVRMALLSKRYDGYLEEARLGKRYGDEDRQAVTLRALWDMGEDWSVDGFLFWSRQDEASAAFTCRLQDPGNLLMAQAVFPGQNQNVGTADSCRQSEALASDYKVLNSVDDSLVRTQSAMAALTLRGEMGDWDLESVTAWSRQYDIERREDQDGVQMNIISQSPPLLNDRLQASGLAKLEEDRVQWSQEVRGSRSFWDDRVSGTAGVFFAYEQMENTPRARAVGPQGLFGLRDTDLAEALGTPPVPVSAGVAPLTLPQNTNSQIDNLSAAVFAQFDWDLTEHWQLTFGLRYSEEEKERELATYQTDFSTYAQAMNQRLASSGSASQTTHLQDGIYSPIPEADFHLLGPEPPVLILEANPETARADRRFRQLTHNLTSTWLADDLWLDRLNLDSGMLYLTFSRGFKAGGLDIKGTDIQPFDAELVDNTELGIKIDALDSRVRFNAAVYRMDYTDLQVTVAETAGLTPINYLTNVGEAVIQGVELELNWAPVDGAVFSLNTAYTDADFIDYNIASTTGVEDRSEEPFPLIPELTVTVSAQKEWRRDWGFITPRLSYYWRDELYTGQDGDGLKYDSTLIDAQGVLNARLSWQSPDRSSRLSLYINNLSDEFYYGGGFAISRSYGAALHTVAPPRELGLEFAVEW